MNEQATSNFCRSSALSVRLFCSSSAECIHNERSENVLIARARGIIEAAAAAAAVTEWI